MDGITRALSDPFYSLTVHSIVPIDERRTLVVLNEESFVVDFDGSEIEVTPFREMGEVSAATPTPSGALWLAAPEGGIQLLEPLGFTRVPLPEGSAPPIVCQPVGSGGVTFGDWHSRNVWYLSDEAAAQGEAPSHIPWVDPLGAVTPTTDGVYAILADTATRGILQTHSGLLRFDGATTQVLSAFEFMPQMTALLARTDTGAIWARSGMDLVEARDGALTGRKVALSQSFTTEMIARGETLYVAQLGGIEAIDTIDLSRKVALELPQTAYGCVSMDERGDLWAGTDGFGLYRKRASGRVDHWTVANGLPTDFLGWVGRTTGSDGEECLWVNSNSGLLCIPIDSLEAAAEDRAQLLRFDMLDTGESYGPNGVLLSNGHLVVPTMDGPIAVDTRSPLPQRSPPALSINAVRSRGTMIRPETSLLGDSDLEFAFGASEFPYRLSSRVEYRLEGHDEDWQKAGPDHTIRYTRLKPGRYQLKLRSKSAGTDYGPTLLGHWYEIHPLWHDRVSVRLLAAAAVLGLGLGLFKLRTSKLIRHGAALEAQIRLREDAEQELRESRTREDLFRRKLARAEEAERSRMARELHDDFSQRLAAVSLSLKLTTDTTRSSLDASAQQRLRDSQADIDALALDIHDLSRQLHPAVLDDLGLVAALRSECGRRSKLSGIPMRFSEAQGGNEPTHEVRLALFRVAQEALQNAVKHASADLVTVRYESSHGAASLTIKDNGEGFDPEAMGRHGLGSPACASV